MGGKFPFMETVKLEVQQVQNIINYLYWNSKSNFLQDFILKLSKFKKTHPECLEIILKRIHPFC